MTPLQNYLVVAGLIAFAIGALAHLRALDRKYQEQCQRRADRWRIVLDKARK